jgi:hypothetical protein
MTCDKRFNNIEPPDGGSIFYDQYVIENRMVTENSKYHPGGEVFNFTSQSLRILFTGNQALVDRSDIFLFQYGYDMNSK